MKGQQQSGESFFTKWLGTPAGRIQNFKNHSDRLREGFTNS